MPEMSTPLVFVRRRLCIVNMEANGRARWFIADASVEEFDGVDQQMSPIHSLAAQKLTVKILLRDYMGKSLPLSQLLSLQSHPTDHYGSARTKKPIELRIASLHLHPPTEKLRPVTRATERKRSLVSVTRNPPPQIEERAETRIQNPRLKNLTRSETINRPATCRKIPELTPRNKLKSIALKDALKDTDWSGVGKEAIRREFSRVINSSNGVVVAPPSNPELQYRYYVGPGNNGGLVDQLLKTRKWWIRVKSINESQLVWSQRKERLIIEALQQTPIKRDTNMSEGQTFTCPLKYKTPGSHLQKLVDVTSLNYDKIALSRSFRMISCTTELHPETLRIHNKLACNYNLANKKALYLNMKQYYTAIGQDYLESMPLTFHITHGEADPEFSKFENAFRIFEAQKRKGKRDKGGENPYNLWIVKPGENSNQGRDITIASMLEHVKIEIQKTVCPRTSRPRSYIVQKYIERPFLYNKRKFDIRCYSMITSINGLIQGYYYPEGYIRTSCREFDLKSVWDRYVHLTNDAVQKHSEDYGKFESGNKLSYGEFQRYLDLRHSDISPFFQQSVLPRIKALVKDTMMATFLKLDPMRRSPSFEVFGYDFMLDADLKPVLIEVNTNPCLELSSAPLVKVIPSMLDGAFRIVLDSLFPEPLGMRKKVIDPLPENRWELIFNELIDGAQLLLQLSSHGAVDCLAREDSCLRLLTDDEDLHSDSEQGD